jgi:hypothetical protein
MFLLRLCCYPTTLFKAAYEKHPQVPMTPISEEASHELLQLGKGTQASSDQ